LKNIFIVVWIFIFPLKRGNMPGNKQSKDGGNIRNGEEIRKERKLK